MVMSSLDEKIASKKRTIKDLASYIEIRSGNNPNYSLFLGAGASVTSGISPATKLVDEWRKELYEIHSHLNYESKSAAKTYLTEKQSSWYNPSNEYSSLFEKKFDLPAQRRRFVESQVDGTLPSIGYAYLVQLFSEGYFDTVFTTNFDDLINEAFYQFSGKRALQCAHDSSIKGLSITSSRPKIIKLHGDYLFDDIKSTLNETESLEVNTKEKLIEFTKEYGLIVVGYAGNDRSIMDVVNFLLKQEEYLKNGIYWCLRKGDEIGPELQKLLHKDKVYFVEIEGFDQLMAELYHMNSKSEGFIFDDDNKANKRASIYKNFIDDKYLLSGCDYIKIDLEKIKRSTTRQSISNLMSEGNEDKSIYKNISDVDFNHLLNIDKLIKHKKYDDAYIECEKMIAQSIDIETREIFINKMVSLYMKQELNHKAMEQCDILLKSDPYNVSYILRKSFLYKDCEERIKYVRLMIKELEHSYVLRNEFAKLSLKYLSSKNRKNSITIEDAINHINHSLKIQPTLDNPAWRLNYRILKLKLSRSIDKEAKKATEEIDKLISDASRINSYHTESLYLDMASLANTQEYEKIKDLIERIKKVIEKSKNDKRKTMLGYISTLNSTVMSFSSKDKALVILNDFISNNSCDQQTDCAPALICRAEYEVAYNRDVELANKLSLMAMNAEDASDVAQRIITIAMYEKENLPKCLEFINSISDDISDSAKYDLLHEIYNLVGNYDDALVNLEESYKKTMNFNEYFVSYIFILLCQGKYDKVINEVNNNLSLIEDKDNRNILIINREAAAKLSRKDVSERDLTLVIGNSKGRFDVRVCATILLKGLASVQREIDDAIDNNYMDYYRFSRWPVMPKEAFAKYNGKGIVQSINAA